MKIPWHPTLSKEEKESETGIQISRCTVRGSSSQKSSPLINKTGHRHSLYANQRSLLLHKHQTQRIKRSDRNQIRVNSAREPPGNFDGMDPAKTSLGKMLLEEITPVVMVLRTPLVEESCLKNSLSFIEMLSPFCDFNNIDG
jgi:hypothetical protein